MLRINLRVRHRLKLSTFTRALERGVAVIYLKLLTPNSGSQTLGILGHAWRTTGPPDSRPECTKLHTFQNLEPIGVEIGAIPALKSGCT